MATINDVVLIYFEDQALSFARIEEILPDIKTGWYHVKLLLLQVPLRSVTWILRETYINGEVFTMGGNRIRLDPVVCPDGTEENGELEVRPVVELEKIDSDDGIANGKVINLADIKRKQ